MAIVTNIPTSSKPVAANYGDEYMLEREIDFSVTANQLAQDDTMTVFLLPANTLVKRAYFEVLTAVTGVTDVDLGLSTDGTADDSLIDGADVSSTGYKQNATLLYVAPLAAANYVVIDNNDADAMDDGKIRVVVIAQDIDSKESAAVTND